MSIGVYKRTEENRTGFKLGNQLGLGKKYMVGRKLSEEHKRKIGNARRGFKHTEEAKRKISLAKQGKPNLYVKGENNYSWKGGRSPGYRTSHAPRPKPEQCEVCGAFGKDFKRGLFCDHDHSTGKFRGWLCLRCNAALGMVKDNAETLIALAEYLKKSRLNADAIKKLS